MKKQYQILSLWELILIKSKRSINSWEFKKTSQKLQCQECLIIIGVIYKQTILKIINRRMNLRRKFI